MDRKQMNLSEMLQTLEEFLTSNLSNFEDKPAIMAVINNLKAANATIKVLTLSQSVSTEADYEIKSNEEDALIITAIKVTDGLKVIAATNNDTRLKIEAQASPWSLGRMRKDNLYVRLKQLYTTALPYAAQLLPLGITSTEIDSLDTDSTKLSKATPAINNIKAKTTLATSDLDNAIKEINAEVNNTLDDLMLEFKLLKPNLYGEYLNARKIINRAAGRSSKSVAPKETK